MTAFANLTTTNDDTRPKNLMTGLLQDQLRQPNTKSNHGLVPNLIFLILHEVSFLRATLFDGHCFPLCVSDAD